jgi:hypothetical protein
MYNIESVLKYLKTLEDIYNQKCMEESDINLLLPTLKKYSELSEHVTEMGVRWVVSTYALMMGKPKKLVSYDIIPLSEFNVSLDYLKLLASQNNINYDFILGDTTQIEIEETDFLFIDTYHVYQQLKTELNLHSKYVKKFIALHDTTTWGLVGEDGGLGLWKAVEEFLDKNKEWSICEKIDYNNGLTILKRN